MAPVPPSLALFAEIAEYVTTEIVDRIDKSGDARLTFLQLPLQIELPPTPRIHARDNSNENQLGAGAFGTVYKAKWTLPRASGAVEVAVAVKILKQWQNEKALVKDFRKEAHMWVRVPYHQNVLPLMGIYFRDNDRIRGLVSPFATDVLGRWLQTDENRTYRERFQLVRDVAEGLRHLHEKDIVHGDVHAGNVFIVGGSAVLGDFGLSRLEAVGVNGEAPQAGSGSLPVSGESSEGYIGTKEIDVYRFGQLASFVMTTSVQVEQADLFSTTLTTHGLRALWEKCQSDDHDRPMDGIALIQRIENLPAIPVNVNL